MRMRKGFSLFESLISLGLTLFIVLGGMQFFEVSRTFFQRLKDRSEDRRAALAALDKIDQDLGEAGRDLAVPIGRGLVEGLAVGTARLTIDCAEKELIPAGDIQPGQTRVAVGGASGIKAGRRVCLFDELNAQVFRVEAVEGNALLLAPEAGALYRKEKSRLLLLSRVEYTMDAAGGIIRRRENGDGAQPLLESVSTLDTFFDEERNVVTVRLALRSNERRHYARTMFPKNSAPSFGR